MYPLLFGLLLDLLLGDPRWALHPIRLFGKLIDYGEQRLNCLAKHLFLFRYLPS